MDTAQLDEPDAGAPRRTFDAAAPVSADSGCFHCGEPLPAGASFVARVRGASHAVCCPGCRAAAEWIEQLGLDDYYRLRTEPALRAQAPTDFSAWDRPQLARMHVRELQPDRAEAIVLVEGLRCAACAWLIERALGSAPGVRDIAVNAAARRVRIVFDPGTTRLSAQLGLLAKLGYTPHPLAADAIDNLRRSESRDAVKRLAVAGLGAMQAMMYAVALYAGTLDGIDPSVRDFFRWLGLLVATPVVLYSARPFFSGALREWRTRRLSMDTPVALAIAAVYVASIVSTLGSRGEVYFDSVSMFVFFLLLGRYAELRTRHRANDVVDALARLQPATAERRSGAGFETVGVHELVAGDIVRVAAGATIPADGVLAGPPCRIDESLLSGESTPCKRTIGDAVVGGSLVLDGPVEVEVRQVGADTILAGIVRLITMAGRTRPQIAATADGIAARFVKYVLVATVLTLFGWLWLDPARAFDSAIAVLVASCPCAFALAAPAALTRAVTVLAQRGVLVVDADALEAVAHADRFVFDKTGTLTEPVIDTAHIAVRRGSREAALAAAAALEQASTHPLAAAVRAAAVGLDLPRVERIAQVGGGGMSGWIGDRQLRLGRAGFALDADGASDASLVLADGEGEIARFPVAERVVTGAEDVVAVLNADGARCEVLSGDHADRVAAAADTLGIARWKAEASPAGKLEHLQALRYEGHLVAMVGDGINDAPVLAGADVALAIGSGSALAHASSGILLGSGLAGLPSARAIAQQMLHTLQGNLRWAMAYNFVAIPLAAAGLVPPWLAAVGMSASSLFVVLRSLRIGRHAEKRAEIAQPFATRLGATAP